MKLNCGLALWRRPWCYLSEEENRATRPKSVSHLRAAGAQVDVPLADEVGTVG